MSEIYFKTLTSTGATTYDYGNYDIPTIKPGKWQEKIEGDLIVCGKGYHLCRKTDLVFHIAEVICPVEIKGKVLEAEDKVVVRQFRLLPPLKNWGRDRMILWVVDCAEHVLPVYEARYPDNMAVRNCIEMTRKFVKGEATREDLQVAADAAAYAAADARAADAAAYAAARAAADAADAAVHAADAARAAAYAAARAAAYAAAHAAYADARAAYAAARAAERQWQIKRLWMYLNGEV